MAWFLDSLTSSASRYATIPTVTFAGDFELKYIGTQQGRGYDGTFIFAGTGVAGQNGLDLYRGVAGAYQLFINNTGVVSTSVSVSNNVLIPDTVIIRRVAGVVELIINGVSAGTVSNSSTLRVDRLYHRNSWPTYGRMALYEFTVVSGGSYNTSWNAVNSPNSGSTWTSTNGQILTQAGTWPSNDSEWVFYDAGGETEYSANIVASYPTYSAVFVSTNVKPVNLTDIVTTYLSYAAAINSTNTKPVITTGITSTYPTYTASLSTTGGNVTYNTSINATYPKYTGSVSVADVNKLNISTSYPAYTSNVNSTNTKPVKTTTVNVSYPTYTVSSSFTAVPQGFSFAVNTTYPVYIANSNLTNIDPIDTVSILAIYAMYSASTSLDADLPSKTVSIVGTYPNYSVSVLVGSESTDKDLSINASYPKYIGTVVIGEFLSLPYRGGTGAHLNVSLGSREVVIKDKSRKIKWRVENARL